MKAFARFVAWAILVSVLVVGGFPASGARAGKPKKPQKVLVVNADPIQSAITGTVETTVTGTVQTAGRTAVIPGQGADVLTLQPGSSPGIGPLDTSTAQMVKLFMRCEGDDCPLVHITVFTVIDNVENFPLEDGFVLPNNEYVRKTYDVPGENIYMNVNHLGTSEAILKYAFVARTS